jgi:hypothetical protein
MKKRLPVGQKDILRDNDRKYGLVKWCMELVVSGYNRGLGLGSRWWGRRMICSEKAREI